MALGATGWLDRLGAVFPREVIRGVQLAVGLLFAKIAWGMVSAPPATFTALWHPGLTAAACLALTIVLLRWRRASALIVVLLGLGMAVASTWGTGPMTLGPTPIVLPSITTADLLVAATLLVLPQIPLTIANSCLAPADAAPVYFPGDAPRVTPSRLARTLGGANLAVGAISGMPLCHGAGGMSAHHAFGARSWRAPAIIGSTLVVLALGLGQDLAQVLGAFPLAILAALLLVAGITHIRLLTDLRGRFAWTVALGVGIVGATGHLLAAVIIGLAAVGIRSMLRQRRPVA